VSGADRSDLDVRRNFYMFMYTQWRYHQVSPKYHITKSANVSFLSILIKGFGFTTSQTLLLGMVNAYHGLVYIGFLWFSHSHPKFHLDNRYRDGMGFTC
jgi:hypothetical protein